MSLESIRNKKSINKEKLVSNPNNIDKNTRDNEVNLIEKKNNLKIFKNFSDYELEELYKHWINTCKSSILTKKLRFDQMLTRMHDLDIDLSFLNTFPFYREVLIDPEIRNLENISTIFSETQKITLNDLKIIFDTFRSFNDVGIQQEHKFIFEQEGLTSESVAPSYNVLTRSMALQLIREKERIDTINNLSRSDDPIQRNHVVSYLDIGQLGRADMMYDKEGNNSADYIINKVIGIMERNVRTFTPRIESYNTETHETNSIPIPYKLSSLININVVRFGGDELGFTYSYDINEIETIYKEYIPKFIEQFEHSVIAEITQEKGMYADLDNEDYTNNLIEYINDLTNLFNSEEVGKFEKMYEREKLNSNQPIPGIVHNIEIKYGKFIHATLPTEKNSRQAFLQYLEEGVIIDDERLFRETLLQKPIITKSLVNNNVDISNPQKVIDTIAPRFRTESNDSETLKIALEKLYEYNLETFNTTTSLLLSAIIDPLTQEITIPYQNFLVNLNKNDYSSAILVDMKLTKEMNDNPQYGLSFADSKIKNISTKIKQALKQIGITSGTPGVDISRKGSSILIGLDQKTKDKLIDRIIETDFTNNEIHILENVDNKNDILENKIKDVFTNLTDLPVGVGIVHASPEIIRNYGSGPLNLGLHTEQQKLSAKIFDNAFIDWLADCIKKYNLYKSQSKDSKANSANPENPDSTQLNPEQIVKLMSTFLSNEKRRIPRLKQIISALTSYNQDKNNPLIQDETVKLVLTILLRYNISKLNRRKLNSLKSK